MSPRPPLFRQRQRVISAAVTWLLQVGTVHQYVYAPPIPSEPERFAEFAYDGVGSKIKFGFSIDPKNDKPRANVDVQLRFVNRGNTAAHSIGSDVYGCWIYDDPPAAGHVDHVEPTTGKVMPGDGRSLILGFSRYATLSGGTTGHLQLNTRNVFVLLIEITFRLSMNPDEPRQTQTLWLTWDPRLTGALNDSTEGEAQLAQSVIAQIRA
jgi:hypothetical protein